MLNTNKRNSEIDKLFKTSYFTKKVKMFFSTKTAGDDYDPYEKNYTYTNLNPITIKCYTRQITPEALVWKQYGLAEIGAMEIMTEYKYADWFRNCNKVEIDNDVYQVYKENVGNRVLIEKRPFQIARIILRKMK